MCVSFDQNAELSHNSLLVSSVIEVSVHVVQPDWKLVVMTWDQCALLTDTRHIYLQMYVVNPVSTTWHHLQETYVKLNAQ